MLLCILAVAVVPSRAASPPQDIPDISTAGLDAVLSWATARTAWAEADFGGGWRASPAYWADEVVYQIQVDRFNNGNLTNDDLNVPQAQRDEQSSGGAPYGLPSWRHGGDLQGIRDRLPYLEDLGVGTLWVTPVLAHDGAYHGYCTASPLQVDPGFGSDEELRELVADAHAQGMYVVLDIVINHLCDPLDLASDASSATTYSSSAAVDHYTCADDLNGNYWDYDDWAWQSSAAGSLQWGDAWFPGFKDEAFFSRCGANSGDDTSGEGSAAVFGDFTGNMFDLDTRNQDMAQLFTELHKFWIAYADIDGFRLDAAKHVTEPFLAYFATNTREYALSLGKENFLTVAEVAASADWIGRRVGNMFTDPSNPDDHGDVPVLLTSTIWALKDTYSAHPNAAYPGVNAAYQFAASGTARSVLKDERAPSDLASYYSSDDYATIAGQADPLLHWILVEIHDWPRFGEAAWYRSSLAAAWLMTSPGTPIIYYGFEQGFNGYCVTSPEDAGDAAGEIQDLCNAGSDDSLKRQDMFINSPWRLGSGVDEIAALAHIGPVSAAPSPAWAEDPFLNRDHTLYQNVRKLVALRKSCAALRRGDVAWRWTDAYEGGWLVYSRVLAGDMEVVVALNTDASAYKNLPSPITVDSGVNSGHDGARYVNVLDPTLQQAATYANGQLSTANGAISVSSNGFVVLVREDQLALDGFDEELGIALCQGDDDEEDEDVQVVAEADVASGDQQAAATGDEDDSTEAIAYAAGAAALGVVAVALCGLWCRRQMKKPLQEAYRPLNV